MRRISLVVGLIVAMLGPLDALAAKSRLQKNNTDASAQQNNSPPLVGQVRVEVVGLPADERGDAHVVIRHVGAHGTQAGGQVDNLGHFQAPMPQGQVVVIATAPGRHRAVVRTNVNPGNVVNVGVSLIGWGGGWGGHWGWRGWAHEHFRLGVHHIHVHSVHRR